MKREAIRKSFKKTLSMALSVAMIVGGVTFLPQAKTEVYAAATTKDVNLGFGGISDPTSTESTATAWTGSKVYYGKNGDKAILWRVLDDSGFLFSEDAFGTRQYHSENTSITWETCELRKYLNNDSEDDDTFLNTYFTTTEQGGIKETDVTNNDNSDYYTEGGNATTGKIFLLSLEEVQNAVYGFGSDGTREASSWWWLRSRGISDIDAALVNNNGYVYSNGSYVYFECSVRPAFNLNLDSVLFTSASGAGKSSSFEAVGSDKVSANEWKLTLKNDNDSSFAATLPTEGTASSDITVNVGTAGTGTYNQTSAILSDTNGTVVAYGKIGENGTGDKTFTIPSSISEGTYTLHVFEEQVNDGNVTDYASNVVTGDITISAAPTPTPVPVPAPIWTPSEDDLYRASLVGWMPVEFTTSQVPYEFELINELQGPLCFDVFNAFRGDYIIGATYSSLVDDMRIQQLSQGITRGFGSTS